MDEQKDATEGLSPGEIPYFPQWTTFSWENVTDAMRNSIGKSNAKPWEKHSNKSGCASSESSEDADSENQSASPKLPKTSGIRETERQLFENSAQFFKEITSPVENPSQIVDALKEGLADILAGSGSNDDKKDVSTDDFSKSLDTSFDEKLKNTQIIGTIPNRNRLTGSSESEDDVSDLSTTESRESMGVDSSSMDVSTESHQDNTSSNKQANGNKEKPVNDEERPLTVKSPPAEIKNDFSSISKEKSSTGSKKDSVKGDSQNVQSDTTQMMSDVDNSIKQKKSDVEHEQEDNGWGKDILAEDIVFVEKAIEGVNGMEVIDYACAECMCNPQPEATELNNELEETGIELSQSEDDLSPRKRTYADVVKVGLKPNAISYVAKPLSPPLYHKRTPKESKRKSAKLKKARRSECYGRKDIDGDYERRVQGKRGPSNKSRGSSPQSRLGNRKSSGVDRIDCKRGSVQVKSPGQRMAQENTSRMRKSTKDKSESWDDEPIPDDTSNDEDKEKTLRKKIKAQQIAKVLQEAKLTLAKLTTESLGSYEKVSCLKFQQAPIVCFNTFEVLQSQEISKSKHMKELANRLHQLTEMGIGNAEEFAEIKDILISLHYLQAKDKYFVEPTVKKNNKKAVALRKPQRDKSIQLFLIASMLFLILMFIYQGQWMAFGIFGSLFVLCIQQEKTIMKYVDGSSDKQNQKSKK